MREEPKKTQPGRDRLQHIQTNSNDSERNTNTNKDSQTKTNVDAHRITNDSKSFSEKQIFINPKVSDYIIKNVERSYEKMFKFI